MGMASFSHQLSEHTSFHDVVNESVSIDDQRMSELWTKATSGSKCEYSPRREVRVPSLLCVTTAGKLSCEGLSYDLFNLVRKVLTQNPFEKTSVFGCEVPK